MTGTEASPLSTPARSDYARTKPDPALDVRGAAPTFLYATDLDHLLAGLKAMRLSVQPAGASKLPRAARARGYLDSHRPHFARLEGLLWERARALPTETELVCMGSGDEAQRWCGFLSRVLPPCCSPVPVGLTAYGRWTSIHNEEGEHEPIFNVGASASELAAALTAAGWHGQLPTRTTLLEHMLHRAEYEYAEHLGSPLSIHRSS